MNEEKTCKNCGALMEKGLLTRTYSWVKKIGLIRYRRVRMNAYRCPRCGFIELWTAPD